MLFVKVRRAVVLGGAIVMLLGLLVNTGMSGPAHHAARMGVAPVTAMAPVAAPTCCVTPAPYHANRIMWTPGYGITSTCNPLAPRSCGYGVTACMAPTPVAPVAACAPCGTYAAAAPVATTTFRPFWSRLFAPLVPTTTYRVAFCSPLAPCPTACAPMAACPTTACLPIASGCPTCPTASCAPACDPCGDVGGYGMPSSSCPSGTCAPAVTETPTPVPTLPPSSSYEPAPAYDPTAAVSSPMPTYEPAPTLGSPVPADGGGAVPRTYKDEAPPTTQPDVRLRPTPAPTPATKSEDSNTGTGAPRLIDPVAQTTARPIRPASYTVPVTRSTSVQPPVKRSVDVSGWRASRD